MSALVDLPGVANPLEDDWWLLEECASGLVMGRLSQDVRTVEVVSLRLLRWLEVDLFYASLLRWWYAPYMEYVLYSEHTIGQMHRDVDWRPQSYSTCQLRKEVSGVYTHCKVESWSANWWKIARCYGLVISCMSGPFRSFCRYQAHSLRIHLCRIQGRRRNRQPQHHGRRSWSVVKNVYFYSSWFLVQFVKTPRAVFLEQGLVLPTCWLARRHHPHSLNPYRSPRPQLHQENLYGQHGSWFNPCVPEKVQELQHSRVELQRRSRTMEIVLHPPWDDWRCCCIGHLEAGVSSLEYP